MAQRIMQYQAVIQLAQGAPQIYNLPQLHRQMIEVLGIKNGDKLVPVEDDQTPRDPVSENMSFLTGKPTKAFIYQDHDAHIAVHVSMSQDPVVMSQIGQNPMAQQMQAAIMAHVAEHVAFQYRQKLQEQLGATLPAPDAKLDEETEVQLSKLVAQAATQLLQLDKAKAAQAQAQQQQQDPIIQMQQQELQIKQQEAQTKAQKVQGELQLKAQELQLKAQEMASKNQPAESPEVTAMRHQQELAQQNQRHQMELAQAQQTHQQQLSHGGQVSELKAQQLAQQLHHKDQAHRQKLSHAEMAAMLKAEQMQKQNEPKGE
jgi:hypothetical protein